MAHLQGGKVDISLIHSTARNTLIKLIDKCNGPKAIVWDEALAGPIGLVCEYALLKEHSVGKMFPLRGNPLPEFTEEHVIFICRPKLHLMDFVAKNVKDDLKACAKFKKKKKEYHLFFVPKTSMLCMKRLKENGVFGSLVRIEEFECFLYPFDSDLVSMEVPEVYREYMLENDPSYLYQVAQTIVYLQNHYGPIPKIWGKGGAAKQVWDLVSRLQKENASERQPTGPRTSCIDQILLIDRSVDLISPLATQLTYEGLIDEIFGLNNNTANFPADKFRSSEERISDSLAEDKKQVILNSSDKLFAEIRDKNFNAVGTVLSKQAKLLANSQVSPNMPVQEMKLYVKRLPDIMNAKKVIALHTSIAECVKEVTDGYEFLDRLQAEQEFLNCIEVDKASSYIEDLIAQSAPLVKVLRLICLQCLTGSGLKPKVLEYYKREIVQVYGLKALLAIMNLEKVGLLKVQSLSRQYTVLRKALRLTNFTDEINPTDITYVHCIYAPLSVRLAEQLGKNGSWKQLQDVLGLLPGPTLDGIQQFTHHENTESQTVILVFFIGGCTFAEISALRFLAQQEDSNVEFVIATTKLINGNTFLESIMEV